MYRLNQQRLETFIKYKLLHEPEGQSASNTVILTLFCKQGLLVFMLPCTAGDMHSRLQGSYQNKNCNTGSPQDN
jgi:hypothetical protein